MDSPASLIMDYSASGEDLLAAGPADNGSAQPTSDIENRNRNNSPARTHKHRTRRLAATMVRTVRHVIPASFTRPNDDDEGHHSSPVSATTRSSSKKPTIADKQKQQQQQQRHLLSSIAEEKAIPGPSKPRTADFQPPSSSLTPDGGTTYQQQQQQQQLREQAVPAIAVSGNSNSGARDRDPSLLNRSPSANTSHKSNVPSPLTMAPSQMSSPTESNSSQSPTKPIVPPFASEKQQQPLPPSLLSAAGPRSIFDIFSMSASKRGGRTFSPKSLGKRTDGSTRTSRNTSPSGTTVSNTSSSSPESTPDSVQSKSLADSVSRLVSQYMDLSDCHTKGHIDISTPPKRRAGGFLGYTRKPQQSLPPPPPCNLYYEVFGTGPIKLFLIMGMVGTTMYWRFQSRYFADHGEYTVCVFDNRGSGKSTIAPGPYKISQMAKDACKLLDHLGWAENVHVIGISLGGMIAQEMCLLNEQGPPQPPSARAGGMDGGRESLPRYASVTFVDTWHSASLALPTVQEIRFSFKGMAAFGDDPKHLIKLVFSPEWIRSPFHDAAAKHAACYDDKGSSDDKVSSDGIGNDDEIASEGFAAGTDTTPTNKDVMGTLFRAIQRDLNAHRAGTHESNTEKSQSPVFAAQAPASRDVSPLMSLGAMVPKFGKLAARTTSTAAIPSDNANDNVIDDDIRRARPNSRPLLHHSRSTSSASAMFKKRTPASPVQSKTEYHPRNNNKNIINGTLEEDVVGGAKREAAGDIHQFIACLGHRLSAQRVRAIRALNPHTRFLVIHGEKDKVIRPFCGRLLAKLLECPVVWIKTAGHMPPIDAHCTFNLVVRAFTRDERWLRELPDKTCLLPARWEEQVRTKEWVASNKHTDLSLHLAGPENGRPDGGSLVADIRLSWLLESDENEEDGSPPTAAAPITTTQSQGLQTNSPSAPPPRSRRTSRIDHIQPVGPLPKQLLFIDESSPDLAACVIPANVVPAPSPPIGGGGSLKSRANTSSSLQAFAEWLSPTPTASSVTAASSPTPPTATQLAASAAQVNEMLACGVLVDAPFRIRRYDLD
ncbi:hypothetical protein IWW48_005362 [Coemansia sp. RSA 1200]|nr:hypothetical protein IWW48_005362 [Coemansia sp. RSA 1200]